MKTKKPKLGRPKKKDKKVGYTFTIEESIKNSALNKVNKEIIDADFRNRLLIYSK